MIRKNTLEQLYIVQKLSMKEISDELQLSLSTVNWWMSKHSIPKRNRSSANYEKYNKGGDPFKITIVDSVEKSLLLGLGLGLFWGEGNKVNETSLRLGNTDPDLVRCYIKFLTDTCGVKRDKIRFGLQVFNDSDQERAMKFWMKMLGAPRSSFMPTISIIASQGSGTYRKKNEYGVVTVYVNNIKLVRWMHDQINAFRKAQVAQW